MEKNQITKLVETKNVRAGYTANGVPTNINIVRSLQNSLARRVALQTGKETPASRIRRTVSRIR